VRRGAGAGAVLVPAGCRWRSSGPGCASAGWLLATGDAILTAALVEVPAELPAAPTTLAVRDGTGWRLDGMKTAPRGASGLGHPGAGAAGERDVGVFVVEPSAAGVDRAAGGDESRHQGGSRWTACVGADAVLGDPAQGAVSSPGSSIGRCSACARWSWAWWAGAPHHGPVRQRAQAVRPPIGSFQAVQMRAADAWVDVGRSASPPGRRRGVSTRLPASDEIRIAKFWASEAGHRITYAAQHLHGGIGVDVDYPIHRYYLWSKTLELTLGSGARQLAALGESIAAER
jgi:acyl-CoA dehydrogenase